MCSRQISARWEGCGGEKRREAERSGEKRREAERSGEKRREAETQSQRSRESYQSNLPKGGWLEVQFWVLLLKFVRCLRLVSFGFWGLPRL